MADVFSELPVMTPAGCRSVFFRPLSHLNADIAVNSEAMGVCTAFESQLSGKHRLAPVCKADNCLSEKFLTVALAPTALEPQFEGQCLITEAAPPPQKLLDFQGGKSGFPEESKLMP